MLHSHIRPSAVIKKDAVKKKKGSSADIIGSCQQEEKAGSEELPKEEQESASCADSDMMSHADGQGSKEEAVTFSADKGGDADWTFMELAEQAKKNQCDVVSLLKGKISITEIAV